MKIKKNRYFSHFHNVLRHLLFGVLFVAISALIFPSCSGGNNIESDGSVEKMFELIDGIIEAQNELVELNTTMTNQIVDLKEEIKRLEERLNDIEATKVLDN